MNDALSLFDDGIAPEATALVPRPMTDAQRKLLREGFASLGVSTAREQFALVEELVRVRLERVTDLSESAAQSLIYALRGRVANAGRANTGDSWADRDEDTWIDRL
jgi:DNA polymerase-3 subunit epsilon